MRLIILVATKDYVVFDIYACAAVLILSCPRSSFCSYHADHGFVVVVQLKSEHATGALTDRELDAEAGADAPASSEANGSTHRHVSPASQSSSQCATPIYTCTRPPAACFPTTVAFSICAYAYGTIRKSYRRQLYRKANVKPMDA